MATSLPFSSNDVLFSLIGNDLVSPTAYVNHEICKPCVDYQLFSEYDACLLDVEQEVDKSSDESYDSEESNEDTTGVSKPSDHEIYRRLLSNRDQQAYAIDKLKRLRLKSRNLLFKHLNNRKELNDLVHLESPAVKRRRKNALQAKMSRQREKIAMLTIAIDNQLLKEHLKTLNKL